MIITNKHFMAILLIRKILSKKIEHNFSVISLEKNRRLIAQFCYQSCSVPFRVFYSTPSYVIVYSQRKTTAEDEAQKFITANNCHRKAEAEPKKTPNQTRIQLCKGKLFLLRGVELLCTCCSAQKLHSCKLTELLHKLSLLNAILLYTLYLLMSVIITGQKNVAVKC